MSKIYNNLDEIPGLSELDKIKLDSLSFEADALSSEIKKREKRTPYLWIGTICFLMFILDKINPMDFRNEIYHYFGLIGYVWCTLGGAICSILLIRDYFLRQKQLTKEFEIDMKFQKYKLNYICHYNSYLNDPENPGKWIQYD